MVYNRGKDAEAQPGADGIDNFCVPQGGPGIKVHQFMSETPKRVCTLLACRGRRIRANVENFHVNLVAFLLIENEAIMRSQESRLKPPAPQPQAIL